MRARPGVGLLSLSAEKIDVCALVLGLDDPSNTEIWAKLMVVIEVGEVSPTEVNRRSGCCY